MQIFFTLSRVGIDGNRWSKSKFYEHVTSYLEHLPGVQFKCLFGDGLGWDMYTALVPVDDAPTALVIRKEVEARCKLVSSKCRPYHFMCRNLHVVSINEINMFGLTPIEQQAFNAKAPAGTYRQISV